MSGQTLGPSEYLLRLCVRAWALDPTDSGMSRILHAGTTCEAAGMSVHDTKEAAARFMAGPRVIRTPETLRDLPGGTILRADTGQAVWLDPLTWPDPDHVAVTGEELPLTAWETLYNYGPLTVLHKPKGTNQ